MSNNDDDYSFAGGFFGVDRSITSKKLDGISSIKVINFNKAVSYALPTRRPRLVPAVGKLCYCDVDPDKIFIYLGQEQRTFFSNGDPRDYRKRNEVLLLNEKGSVVYCGLVTFEDCFKLVEKNHSAQALTESEKTSIMVQRPSRGVFDGWGLKAKV